ncbi:MAG: hypothetical protein ACJ786_39575 [Catenulispora sp.]
MQGAAGNAAVSRLVAQRLRATPGTDPKFAALRRDVTASQGRMAAHPPATAESAAAQHAAQPPQDDKLAQGKVANAEKMNAAKPGEFNKAAFVKAVNDAIAAQAPKNLDEADKFADSGKAGAVKAQVAGQVTAGKQQSAAPITSTTNAPPDTAAARDKPVTPLTPDQPPAAPPAPDPANAVPDPAPSQATDLSAGPKQVDAQMAEAQVTDQQLAVSNEPAFGDALTAKKQGEAHAATAPGQVRAAEARTLSAAKAEAGQAGSTAMAAMAADRRKAGAAVGSGKTGAKGSDESKRAQVTATLQKVFDATKTEVEAVLAGLDKKVDETFNKEEGAARAAFTAEHQRRMEEYKDKRYSGWTGKMRWVKDKFTGLPEEANQIFVTARTGYVARMQQVISTVADLIGAELGRAKQRIAKGRADLQAEVARLPKDLQAIGRQAAADFAGKFDELTEAVNSKGQELVQALASRYTEALGKVDEEIAEEKEKNKGLIAKAMDAVGGVIKTILELKNLLLGVLAKAASAVMAIIKDPIAFLGKLVSAVGAGLHAFLANIGEHLKKGLLGWLLGALSSAGLALPAKFDLRGIITMIGSLLGLTWGAIRGRIVSRGVPEQAMGAVEQSVPIAQKLQSEGVAGIWQTIAAKVGDLKANLFGKITQFLIPTVLIAGITWIISLLNPASAFVKACKMIIDIVTFIVERGAQIIAFVNAVLDAVIAIAGGGTGGVPTLIETALAMSIPVLIGALAAILGIGGIAEKVKKFFQSLTKPVMKAVDWVVDKIVTLAKKLWAKLKSKFGRKDMPGAPGTAGPARALDVAKGFDMAGAGHTLYAQTRNGRVVVEMASARRAWVGGLVRQAIVTEQQGQRRPDLLAKLNELLGPLQEIERAEAGPLSDAKLRVIEQRLVAMTLYLQLIGHTWGLKSLTDFTKSKYVINGRLADAYQSGAVIRATFYPAFNSAAKAHYRSELLAAVNAKKAAATTLGHDPLFGSATSYLCPGNRVSTSPHLADRITSTGLPALDHRLEVSSQWNRMGHNTPQPPRETWYNDTTNLDLMCTSCNGKKSGPDFILDIGPDFRGPGDIT